MKKKGIVKRYTKRRKKRPWVESKSGYPRNDALEDVDDDEVEEDDEDEDEEDEDEEDENDDEDDQEDRKAEKRRKSRTGKSAKKQKETIKINNVTKTNAAAGTTRARRNSGKRQYNANQGDCIGFFMVKSDQQSVRKAFLAISNLFH